MSALQPRPMSDELQAAIAKLVTARGAPAEWMARESALLRFIAGVERPVRVFCRGEVRLDKGHFPAVLTYNPIYKQALAWAPSGRKNAMESHHEGAFYGDCHLVGIAREVLAGPETETRYAQAIEAQRAATENTDAVHESAVPPQAGCAQGRDA
jgi:hypothetical protein